MPVRKLEKTVTDSQHQQLPLFNKENNPVLKKLDEQDILEMTPMDAMNFLYSTKKDLKKEEK